VPFPTLPTLASESSSRPWGERGAVLGLQVYGENSLKRHRNCQRCGGPVGFARGRLFECVTASLRDAVSSLDDRGSASLRENLCRPCGTCSILFRLTPDLRPGLSYAAPFGAGVRSARCASSSTIWFDNLVLAAKPSRSSRASAVAASYCSTSSVS
jgi:hypothetical protein